jgi:hypothetical protein
MDNTIFITRFLQQHKHISISYIDVLNHIFDNLLPFENVKKTIDDYYEQYMFLHRLKNDKFHRIFDGTKHYISIGKSKSENFNPNVTNDITEIDICYYMIDNKKYDNALFETRMDFLSWCKRLNVVEPQKSENYSIFKEINGTMEIDTIQTQELKLLSHGIKENHILLLKIQEQTRCIIFCVIIYLLLDLIKN